MSDRGAESELETLRNERDEALRRMDEALAEKYAAISDREAKIQDFAQETLRGSELRAERDSLREALDDARDYVALLHGAESYEQLAALQARADRFEQALAEVRRYSTDALSAET